MTFAAGYEFTFTNERLIEAGKARGEIELDTRENLAACEAFAAAIRAAIGEHEYGTEDDGFGFTRHVFTYSGGYWIKLELDPWVVEITGKHLTVDGYRRIAPRMNQLFAVAASVGLTPHERIGGGHVHICRSSFGGDPLALRNFIVDYFNHPELALGILGWDVLNASPLCGAPAPAITSFIDGLARFDAGQLNLDGFLQHLRLQVYTYSAEHLPTIAVLSKYQALSVDRPSTVEIRAIRPQRSFAEFMDIVELFRARIAFLAGRAPIPYRYERWPATELMPPTVARARFASYLAEMQMQHWPREDL